MPKLSSSALPKYRKHRASGQAIVTLAGKDHYLGPYDSAASRREYDRLTGEWVALGRPSAPAPQAGDITVMEVCAAFQRHAKQHYMRNGKPTGGAENFRPVISLLKEHYGRTAAVEFGPLALKALRLRMIGKDWCRRYVNECTRRVVQIFRWATSEELVPPSVPQALSTVAGLRKGMSEVHDHAPVAPVEEGAIEATLKHLSPIVKAMLQLQLLSAARPGEICKLRPCDLDRSGEVWKYFPAEHKTEHHGKRRTIYLGPKAQAILLPFLLRPADSYCFSPKESAEFHRRERHAKRVTPLSCGNRPGIKIVRKPKREPRECFTNDSYRRAISRACEKAKIPAWNPHRLRHTAATEIRSKFGLEATQASLGHSRADVTQIYAERNDALAARVAREVG